MKRREFISELKKALENDLNKEQIQAQVNYYNSYIDDEVKSGRDERTVIDELGDPFAIARNIIVMEPNEEDCRDGRSESSDETQSLNKERRSTNGKSVQWSMNSKWGCWITLIVIILIIVGILFALFGLVQLLWPILIPLILILFVYNFFKKRS